MADFARETINEVILWRLRESQREMAYYAEDKDGGFRPVYYAENRRAMLGLAAALGSQGLGRGDRIAILADVRHEWVTCDFANLLAGLVTVGIYPTSTPEAVGYILQHSECRWIVIEGKYLVDLAETIAACPGIERVVTLDEVDLPESFGTPVVTLSALLEEGAARMDAEGEEVVLAEARKAEPEDLLTIVYTSGTTGPPKGAMLTHRNIFHVCDAVAPLIPFGPNDRGIVYLPLAHILQRYTIYLGLRLGGTGYYLSEIPRLGEVIPEVKPTMLAAVPRVMEKIHGKAMARAEELEGFKRTVFDWAFDIGLQRSHLERKGLQPGWFFKLRHAVADRLVLSKVRQKLGGEIKLIVSGGAPLAPHLSDWFHAAGILVIEGYGLTETSAPATTNTPEAYKFGTVGRAIPGTEVAIADDGEILVKGPGVFRGYYKNPEATAEAFNEDGFFKTGDIGELDDEGFLKITDRKKDLIITAGGKNISPANIENLLKGHLLIGQAMVYGDRRPYLVCVIALEPEDCIEWAEAAGVAGRTVDALCSEPKVREAIETHLTSVNARLAPYETLKKWVLAPVPFLPENGYLTPTMKLKRRTIIQDFGELIDALYDEPRT